MRTLSFFLDSVDMVRTSGQWLLYSHQHRLHVPLGPNTELAQTDVLVVDILDHEEVARLATVASKAYYNQHMIPSRTAASDRECL